VLLRTKAKALIRGGFPPESTGTGTLAL
jgi:hypothetical protein